MPTRKFQQVASNELPELLQQGVVLIDVRRPDEWQSTGVVADSLLLTFFDQAGKSNPPLWWQQLQEQKVTDKPLALICRSGYRSAIICDYLLDQGLQASLYNVQDGILGWLQEGFPVVRCQNNLPSG